ncbi:uncharacterized protein PAC_17562 [Phialocephala subalpina]|uniref:SMP-30/Gluconolactonase/LRE-like region domain-containing protein n=1 Tax=Phialocephala subalpina TaxID=576137 RepID=A0A1L7XRI7_9HELO|nr:uncharacterized protein PAC_17562 [Phialocephala subalpina]
MAQTTVLDPPLSSHVVHQFPLPTFIENLAIRPNGQILITVVNTASLILLDPSVPTPAPVVIHKFDDVLAVTGIIELEPDVFYVAIGNFDLMKGNEFGSYSIWKVDMNEFEKEGKAEVEKIASLEKHGLPNGFEALPGHKDFFIFADSDAGTVVKVDVKTGVSSVLIDVDEMKHLPEGMPLGINGLKVLSGYLYWSNTSKKIFNRIRINSDGASIGTAEILASDIIIDDFCFDKKGNAWVTTHSDNTVAVIKPKGGVWAAGENQVVTAIGKVDEMTVAGGTACHFGRGEGSGHVLYLTTTGGLSAPVGGDKVEGGKVVAIDTSKFE